MTTYEKIKELCELKGFPVSQIGQQIPGLKVDKSAVTGWKKGSRPRPDKIKLIAEFFDVPIEYLRDDDIQIQTIQDNHGVIGTASAPVTIINGTERELSEQEAELLNIFSSLNIVKRAKVLSYADELLDK